MRFSRHRVAEVLQHDRDAAERAVRQVTRRLKPGPFHARVDNRVEDRVAALDPLDRGVDELKSRHLAGADEFGLPVASSAASSCPIDIVNSED
jgi:hypothetical protein